MKVVLTKREDAILGELPRGEQIEVKVPKSFAGDEYDARRFARESLRRDHPKENSTEWDAEVHNGMCGACGSGLVDGYCPQCESKIAAGL